MKLSWTEDYAVLVVCNLANANKGSYVSLSDISKSHGVSLPMLKKLARRLKFAGIITSKEGLGGGYLLQEDPQDISIWSICQAVKPVKYNNAPEPYDVCPFHDCIHQKLRKTISDSIRLALTQLTVADITS